jgi:pyridoxal phosphate enzyme (YggS family)
MSATSTAIAERLAELRARIETAAARSGRPASEVTLVGVAKRQSVEKVAEAVRAGLKDVGENYVQEAVARIEAVEAQLAGTDTALPRWHFIGQLQRNKARDVVRAFDVVASVDRARLGESLEQRAAADARQLDVLLQVDLSGEANKGGVAPDELGRLLEAASGWSHLRVTGLMAIPAPGSDPEQTRPAFAPLRELRDRWRGKPGAEALQELSMGMSSDFEVAIEEGATLVRVGTALFGPRDPA